MKLSIVAGATSQSVNIFAQDSSSTTGAGLTGLVFNSAGLVAYYTFAGANAGSTAITLATLAAVNSAYSSGGFKEIDATNMPGLYRLDLPNAVLAGSKGRSVVVMLKGATNLAQLVLEIELTGWDNQDAVHGGMSALPNTAVATNGSLITAGTGTSQLSVAGGVGQADAAKINGVSTASVTAVNANQGTTQPINFTGAGASALTKSDIVDIAGAAVNAAVAQLGVNVVNVGGTPQTARDLGNGIPAAAPGASGGLLISGSNAGTTTLGALTVTGTLTISDGVTVSRSTGNSDAVSLTGSGTGAGLKVRSGSGATGNGLDVAALSTNGHAVSLAGNGSGDGLKAAGGATGNGVEAIGGGTSGDGLKASAAGSGVPIRGDLTGNIHGTLDTLTTYTGNTPQTGDVFAQLPTRFSLLSIDASGRIDLGSIKGTPSVGQAGSVGIDWAQVANKTSAVALTSTTVSSSQVVASVTAGVTVSTNNDKTGYSLTQAFPTNFASLSIDLSGRIDLGKVLGVASAGTPGYLGIDWGAIANKLSVVALTNTTISSAQVVGSVDVASVNGHSTSGVTTIGAVWGTSVAPTFTGSLVKVDVTDWAASPVAVPNVAGVPLTDVGYLKGVVSAGAAGYAGIDWGHVNAPTAAVGLTNTTISPSQVVASVTAPVSVGNVTVGGYAAGQDPFTLVMASAMTESYAGVGTTKTLPQALYELTQHLGNMSIAGTAYTTYKLNGTTVAQTYLLTLDSDNQPTAIARAA